MPTLSCRLCGRRNIPNTHDCAAAQAALDAQAPKIVAFQFDPQGTTSTLVALDEHGRLWRHWHTNGIWALMRPVVDSEARYAAGIAADKQEQP